MRLHSTLPTHCTVFDAMDAELDDDAQARVLIDAGEYGPDMPPAPVTIAEARVLTADPDADRDLRDAVCTTLVRRAQENPRSSDRTLLLWTMLPTLRGIAARLRRRWPSNADDIRSDVIIGFLDAVREVDPEDPNLGKRLWWKTYGAARKACRTALLERPSEVVHRLAEPTCDDIPSTLSATVDVGDPVAREGIRLGSIAGRLGLRATVARRNGCGEAA